MRALVIGLAALLVASSVMGQEKGAKKDPKRGIVITCPDVGQDRPPNLLACGTTDDKDQPVFGVVIDPTNPDMPYPATTILGPPGVPNNTWKLEFVGLPEDDGLILRVESWQGTTVSDEVVFNVKGGVDNCKCDKIVAPSSKQQEAKR